MADDIRIGIKVTGTESVIAATNKTLSLESSVKKLSAAYSRDSIKYNAYRKGINELAAAYGKTDAELRKYANSLRAAKTADEQAKAASKALKDELRAMTAMRREANEMNRRYDDTLRASIAAERAAAQEVKKAKDARRALRMEFREGYAAQVQYRAARMRLSQAERDGIITTQQAAAAQKNLGVFLQQGGRHMSRTGVMTQQAGYQVGDFLVQVQGGTNWMVAFGQQATQLVGALYMLPPAVLAVSRSIFGLTLSVGTMIAAAGILIPLITAVGAYFMRTSSEAKNAKKELSSLEEEVKSLTKSIEDWGAAKEAASMGISMEELTGKKNIQAARDELAKLTKELNTLYDQSSGEGLMEDLSPKGKRGKAETRVAEAEKLLNDLLLKQDEDRLATFLEQNKELSNQAEIQRLSVQYGAESARVRAAERQQEVDSFNASIDAQVKKGKLSTDYGFTLKLNNQALSNQAGIIEEANIKREKTLEIQEAIIDADRKYQEFLNDRFTTNEKYTQELQDQIDLNKVILKYGEDSKEVRAEEARQARVAYETELRKTTLIGTQIEDLLTLYDTSVSITDEMYNTVDAAEDLGTRLGIAFSDAINLIRQAKAEAMVDIDAFGGAGEFKYSTPSSFNKPKKTRSGGGVGKGEKEDPAAKALESYRQLVATYDEVEAKTLKVEAARKTLTEAERLGVITSQQSDEALKEYTKSLGDAKNPMLDLANTASQALSQAFMSIVDGSKSAADAFGDMARTIIKQAFEMAVINPIINSLFGGVSGFSMLPSFFADGGVFSGGGQVKAYASGGVVGGPTYFPMSGNKTGLMGEAGPEAIMPLKRGKDGKLGVATDGGGSQTVTVVQNFSFQANGDESVKKIIAQAAPSISAMAQKGMMDQRRRGGSMKSTFG